MTNGNPRPKISIVTPSFNQGQSLEETIRSVLLQGYPNLEYIIMDGGSTDKSVEIIKKYEPRLAYWVSERDNGQADAIARGFGISTGEILGWVNSDDYLLEGALGTVGDTFFDHKEVDLVVGGGFVVNKAGMLIDKYYSFLQTHESLLAFGQFFAQMSCFWRKSAYEEVGGIDTDLKFCFDYDLFLKLTARNKPFGIQKMLSAYRKHEESKSSTIWETIGLKEFTEIRLRHGYGQWPEETRRDRESHYCRLYHKNRRKGILMDAFRQPRFFLSQLCEKYTGDS